MTNWRNIIAGCFWGYLVLTSNEHPFCRAAWIIWFIYAAIDWIFDNLP